MTILFCTSKTCTSLWLSLIWRRATGRLIIYAMQTSQEAMCSRCMTAHQYGGQLIMTTWCCLAAF